MINLNMLNIKDRVEIDEDVIFNDSFKTKNILGLDGFHAKGYVKLSEDDYVIYLEVKGTVYLEDSITLEKIPYKLDFIIDDVIDNSCINNQNMLDLNEELWQNIVLEVPISYTIKSDAVLSGDNWRIVNDKPRDEIDPRMEKLLDYNKGGEDNGSSI